MKLTYPAGTVLVSLAIWAVLIFLLTGCQTIIFSEGETSGMVEMLRGETRFCKLVTTDGITLSDEVILEFAKKCRAAE